MSDTETTIKTAATLKDMYLHRLRFRDDRTMARDEEGVDSQFLLNVLLFEDEAVGVQFGVTCRTKDRGLLIQVVYRLEFERGPTVPETMSGEDFAREVGARIAPIVAFPFIRETIASVTGKSGDALLLPIVNVGAMFKSADVRVRGPRATSAPPPPALPKPAKPKRTRNKDT